MAARNNGRSDNRQRLMEIVEVVRRHEITKGITPDKLCAIIEELGPTFIKLGQILSMRSDILPKTYCEALTRLRSDVAPMPFEQVKNQIENAYGRPLEEVFSSFDQQALGSASIAQAHAATLQTGEKVVVKVQREGIHEIMGRDILLLKQACKLLKYAPVNELVDFNQVLDEMWVVAQEEMNFQTEAANLERFRKLNEDVAFVSSPALYRDYTTTTVLVMERIDGVGIAQKDELAAAGYDLSEIGAKLADNYVKQIMDDGFFHADPHPGNLRVREGKIVWLDMGMMGSLSDRQRELIGKAITGVARGDVNACRDAVPGAGRIPPEAGQAPAVPGYGGFAGKVRLRRPGHHGSGRSHAGPDRGHASERHRHARQPDHAGPGTGHHRGRCGRFEPGAERDERGHGPAGTAGAGRRGLAQSADAGCGRTVRKRSQIAGNPRIDRGHPSYRPEGRSQSGH